VGVGGLRLGLGEVPSAAARFAFACSTAALKNCGSIFARICPLRTGLLKST